MPLFALDSFWSDTLAISGFVIGLVGTILGAVGLWYTYHQVQKVEEATSAANAATQRAQKQAEQLYSRFVGAFASRLLVDLRRAVLNQKWDVADARAEELADLLAALPSPAGDEVAELREFGVKFAGGGQNYGAKKWDAFAKQLHSHLDAFRTLRLGDVHGPNRPDDPGPAVPRDRPGPAQPDSGGQSEVGPGDRP